MKKNVYSNEKFQQGGVKAIIISTREFSPRERDLYQKQDIPEDHSEKMYYVTKFECKP
jgi:hypothetical protein